MEINAHIASIEGKSMVLAIVRDITERKRTEEAIRRANRQLNLLASISRHDITNKLTVIMGYLQIAAKKCTDPAITQYLDKIQVATGAIHTQVEFTKVYQNLGTHEPQWQRLEGLMPGKHAPPTIQLHHEVPDLEVYADPMLEKVFFNLLDNSIRHGEHVSEILVYARESDEALRIIWEDNGVGIRPEEKEKIFERGFGKNTGLGMFLTREILLLTDLAIQETGEYGAGARFEIMVPKGMYRTAS